MELLYDKFCIKMPTIKKITVILSEKASYWIMANIITLQIFSKKNAIVNLMSVNAEGLNFNKLKIIFSLKQIVTESHIFFLSHSSTLSYLMGTRILIISLIHLPFATALTRGFSLQSWWGPFVQSCELLSRQWNCIFFC
jgi:hypothetical protein